MNRVSLRNNQSRFEASGTLPVTNEPDGLRKRWLKFMTLEKLPITLEEIQEIVLNAMHDEWQFCLGLHLHLGRRPLFVLDADVDLGMTRLAMRNTYVEILVHTLSL